MWQVPAAPPSHQRDPSRPSCLLRALNIIDLLLQDICLQLLLSFKISSKTQIRIPNQLPNYLCHLVDSPPPSSLPCQELRLGSRNHPRTSSIGFWCGNYQKEIMMKRWKSWRKKEKSESQPGRESHILFSNFAMNANSLPEGQRSISAWSRSWSTLQNVMMSCISGGEERMMSENLRLRWTLNMLNEWENEVESKMGKVGLRPRWLSPRRWTWAERGNN